MPTIIEEKIKNNTLSKSDFKDNLKLIGNYFKYLFINDIRLDPTTAKSFLQINFLI